MIFPLSVNAQITPISTEVCNQMKLSHTITDKNPIGCDRLNSVKFKFIDFSGKDCTGEVVVLDVLAPQVEDIFRTLYTKAFPLKKAVPLEYYNGDDKKSMRDNNTSAFNGRSITNAKEWSKHAYGSAIDINPLNNPYISSQESGIMNIMPPESYNNYVNRINYQPWKKARPGLAEDVRDVFFSHGFLRWGGYWDNPIDYQHFEIGSYDYINKLLKEPLDKARSDFFAYGESYRKCMQDSTEKNKEYKMKICVEKTMK